MGRPKSEHSLSNAERQRRYRERHRKPRPTEGSVMLGPEREPEPGMSATSAPAVTDVERLARAQAEREQAVKLGGGQTEAAAEPAPEVQEVDGMQPQEVVREPFTKPIPPPSPPPPVRNVQSLESYVADAVLAAEIEHSRIPTTATLSTKTLAETLARAESYARWRWASFHAGTTVSL